MVMGGMDHTTTHLFPQPRPDQGKGADILSTCRILLHHLRSLPHLRLSLTRIDARPTSYRNTPTVTHQPAMMYPPTTSRRPLRNPPSRRRLDPPTEHLNEVSRGDVERVATFICEPAGVQTQVPVPYSGHPPPACGVDPPPDPNCIGVRPSLGPIPHGMAR